MLTSFLAPLIITDVWLYRMLDEFGNEMENTDSKIDGTMKKMAKVLRISNGNYTTSHYVAMVLTD